MRVRAGATDTGTGTDRIPRQAVACAVAVASYGGARYAAKAELRTARRDNMAGAGDGDPDVGALLPEPAVAA